MFYIIRILCEEVLISVTKLSAAAKWRVKRLGLMVLEVSILHHLPLLFGPVAKANAMVTGAGSRESCWIHNRGLERKARDKRGRLPMADFLWLEEVSTIYHLSIVCLVMKPSFICPLVSERISSGAKWLSHFPKVLLLNMALEHPGTFHLQTAIDKLLSPWWNVTDPLNVFTIDSWGSSLSPVWGIWTHGTWRIRSRVIDTCPPALCPRM